MDEKAFQKAMDGIEEELRKLAAGEVEDDSADLPELLSLDDPDAVVVVGVPTLPKKKRKRTKKAK